MAFFYRNGAYMLTSASTTRVMVRITLDSKLAANQALWVVGKWGQDNAVTLDGGVKAHKLDDLTYITYIDAVSTSMKLRLIKQSTTTNVITWDKVGDRVVTAIAGHLYDITWADTSVDETASSFTNFISATAKDAAFPFVQWPEPSDENLVCGVQVKKTSGGGLIFTDHAEWGTISADGWLTWTEPARTAPWLGSAYLAATGSWQVVSAFALAESQWEDLNSNLNITAFDGDTMPWIDGDTVSESE